MNRPYGPTHELSPESAQEFGTAECRPPRGSNPGGIPSTNDIKIGKKKTVLLIITNLRK